MDNLEKNYKTNKSKNFLHVKNFKKKQIEFFDMYTPTGLIKNASRIFKTGRNFTCKSLLHLEKNSNCIFFTCKKFFKYKQIEFFDMYTPTGLRKKLKKFRIFRTDRQFLHVNPYWTKFLSKQ